MRVAKIIQPKFGGTCLTCDEHYGAGNEVYWLKDVGCWHLDCDPPKNLKIYRKDADARQRLGLDRDGINFKPGRRHDD